MLRFLYILPIHGKLEGDEELKVPVPIAIWIAISHYFMLRHYAKGFNLDNDENRHCKARLHVLGTQH